MGVVLGVHQFTDRMPSCLLKMAPYSTALCCSSMSRLSPYLLTRVLIRGRVLENLEQRRGGGEEGRRGGGEEGRRGTEKEGKEGGEVGRNKRREIKEMKEVEREGKKRRRGRKGRKERVHTHLMLSFMTALMAYSRVICEDCGLCKTRSTTSNTSSSVTCKKTCSGGNTV